MLPATRRETWTPFEALQREIDRAFERAWGVAGEPNGGTWTASYPVDIREDDNNIVVEAELPGFTKEDVNITMEQGVLTISAQRKDEPKEGEQHLRERRFFRVSRSFRLPIPVDENNVQAHLEHGVLTLMLPKKEEVKPRRIEVT